MINYMAAPGCKNFRTATKRETIKDYYLIFDTVCDKFGYHPDTVLFNNNSQKREYVTIRQITMSLFVLKLKSSLRFTGNFFGGKDHATVIHAIKTVGNLRDTNKKFREDTNSLFEGVVFPDSRKVKYTIYGKNKRS